jgi:hypothetical protein
MNRNIFLLVLLFALGVSLFAQEKSNSAKHLVLPSVYLGHSDYKGGPIKREEFDNLLKQGLTAHDSAGYKYKVISFDFNYAERELYEDSIGNLKVMTDFLFEYCPGDTITGNISASIYDRVKAGDTVFIDRVRVARYIGKTNKTLDTEVVSARGLKCVITK